MQAWRKVSGIDMSVNVYMRLLARNRVEKTNRKGRFDEEETLFSTVIFPNFSHFFAWSWQPKEVPKLITFTCDFSR